MCMRPLYEPFFVSLDYNHFVCSLFQAIMYQCEKCSESYNRQSSLVKHSHVHKCVLCLPEDICI